MADRTRQDYLNFPIGLLKGFLESHKRAFAEIIYYECYTKSQQGEDVALFLESLEIIAENELEYVENGQKLHEESKGQALTGFSIDVFNDFWENPKTEKEKVVLLAYLALKSILGKSTYSKVTALHWLSRMDGKNRAVAFIGELSDRMQRYSSQHHIQWIRAELEEHWGLVWVLSRGWQMSLTLTYEALYEKTQLKRMEKDTKKKEQNEEKKAIREKVDKRLKKSPP
jgi:hypothetical protein